MSSPIALPRKNKLQNLIIGLHQRLSHSNRVDILATEVAMRISTGEGRLKDIRCLDVGCGDMKISERINAIIPDTIWTCIDLYELPDHLKDVKKWDKYKKYDGGRFPLDDKSVDIVLFCDVLHHVRGDVSALLREAGRVGNTVIVKDHFEYSFYSRAMLKAMDVVGNWGYGVRLPDRYFTESSFERLYLATGLKPVRIDVGIDLYSHLPIVRTLLSPKWHFIAVLSS